MIKKSITEFVKRALVTNPSLRDNYKKLFCYVVCYEMGLKDFSKMTEFSKNHTMYDFFQALLKGQVSTPETTRRTWQKLQEENPELAGRHRQERKQYAETVKQEVKEINQQSLFN